MNTRYFIYYFLQCKLLKTTAGNTGKVSPYPEYTSTLTPGRTFSADTQHSPVPIRTSRFTSQNIHHCLQIFHWFWQRGKERPFVCNCIITLNTRQPSLTRILTPIPIISSYCQNLPLPLNTGMVLSWYLHGC